VQQLDRFSQVIPVFDALCDTVALLNGQWIRFLLLCRRR
jgi:hypothetical protein